MASWKNKKMHLRRMLSVFTVDYTEAIGLSHRKEIFRLAIRKLDSVIRTQKSIV